jgi:hypothetical protein
LRALFRILCSAEAVFATLFSPINVNSTARVELSAYLFINLILPKSTNEPFDVSIPSLRRSRVERAKRHPHWLTFFASGVLICVFCDTGLFRILK